MFNCKLKPARAPATQPPKLDYQKKKEEVKRAYREGKSCLVWGAVAIVVALVIFGMGVATMAIQKRENSIHIGSVFIIILAFILFGIGKYMNMRARDIEIELEVYEKQRSQYPQPYQQQPYYHPPPQQQYPEQPPQE